MILNEALGNDEFDFEDIDLDEVDIDVEAPEDVIPDAKNETVAKPVTIHNKSIEKQ